VDARDRIGDSPRFRHVHDHTVRPFLDQFGCGIVLACHHDARSRARRGFDDDHPVALPARGEQHAQRSSQIRMYGFRGDEAGRGRDLGEAVLVDRPLELGPLGTVAVEHCTQSGDPMRGRRHRRDREHHALLGYQTPGKDHQRLRRLRRMPLQLPGVLAAEHRDGAAQPQLTKPLGVQV
jgi:hypothetical protein